MKTHQLLSYSLEGDQKTAQLRKALREKVESKLGYCFEDLTMKNLLVDQYIALTDASVPEQK